MKHSNWLIRSIFILTLFIHVLLKIKVIPDVYFDELFPTYSTWFFLIFHITIIFFIVYPIIEQLAYHHVEKVTIKKLERSSFFGEHKMTLNGTGFIIEHSGTSKTER